MNLTLTWRDCVSMLHKVEGVPPLPSTIKAGALTKGCLNMDLSVAAVRSIILISLKPLKAKAFVSIV